jgi:cysteine-rich repeat protein
MTHTSTRRSSLGLLLALGLSTCFTADDLVDQPCQVDADCNPQGDLLGAALRCEYNVCGYVPRCGDGIIDAEVEACDHGADNLGADYADGPGRCSATNCQPLPYCGDAKVDAPHEQCDDGNKDDTDDCPGTCRAAACGDGFVGPGEACDPASDPDCSELCARPTCGDGLLQGLEECDDGNPVDTDDCLSTCLQARCGDAVVHPQRGETCDDGNHSDGDACVGSCAAAACGDGYLQAGVEACDDGNKDFFDACVGACVDAACGDGYLHVGDEQCDDGNLDGDDDCSPTCKHEHCGDGTTQKTEACDDGNNADGDGCSAACAFEDCGDGLVQGQEQCDDGNAINDDACVYCKLAVCGDGVTQEDVEECDDGNGDDDDACTGTCQAAVCGDGHVWAGEEPCDDGDADNTDACLDTCVAASCGDGFLQQGVEACDDGNLDDLDACLVTCQPNVCGDGKLDPENEECDDGDLDNNDGCANDCKLGAAAIWSSSASYHRCALREGKARCWGFGDVGQLGYGSTANIGDEKVDLPPVDLDLGGVVLKIATGYRHTCALMADKSVRCWGSSYLLGRGTGSNGNVGDEPGEMPPKDPVVLGGPVADIVAGENHTCALLEGPAGEVFCWGASTHGQLGHVGAWILGDNESPEQTGPVPLGGPVAQITAGENHNCALFKGPDAGKVRCWGYNASGQLGLGHTFNIGDDEAPEDAPFLVLNDIGDPVARIDAGGSHTCALLVSGKMRCWGEGGPIGTQDWSSVGDNEDPNPAGDVKMLQPGDAVVEMALGKYHTCVRLATGKVRCWGIGFFGQLGYEHSLHLGLSPGDVAPHVDIGGPALDLAAGLFHTCALIDGGGVRCWGYNVFGMLGVGHTVSIGDEDGEMPPQASLIYTKPK